MIDVRGLNFSVGTFALKDVALRVEEGEYFVVLGPTGSGKTLLLECLCGLNRIDSGRVEIAGTDVTDLEPRARGIGYLPQDYALFPHKTVRQNVAFGLEVQGESASAVRSSADELMGLVGVEHLAERLPANLSGGEKQRVALARALAIRPRALFLDEPVSAVDEQSRDTLCRELKALQRATATTTVHVCHNFSEMLTVADRVAVLKDGRVVQVGTPVEVVERPRDRFVAEFVRAVNLVEAQAGPAPPAPLPGGEGGGVRPLTRLECEGVTVFSSESGQGQVTFVVRPENIGLARARPERAAQGENVLRGKVKRVSERGALVQVTVTCGQGLEARPLSCCTTDASTRSSSRAAPAYRGDKRSLELAVSLSKREHRALDPSPGDGLFLSFSPEHVHVLRD